ncbi:hypothetical protein QLQ15_05025 [Lysobacter sp. LF1]|uniref:Uncharacterized protein n=1 Tax=Lysobacter stagni TaxID=3045172 RepID=A0ABT6XDS3_9GAMM|nr:hypothetical protein [Lysobacter sp. LF1]MDI9238273.1 hypothetical protein [Lysobacter sp. LF1]
MNKAIAYLVIAVVGVFLLRSTGLLDGMFSRGNLEERGKFWQDTVARETPVGTGKDRVDALVARHGMTLECFDSSLKPPVSDCLADDPASKGGTSGHPVAVQLRFTFRSGMLEKFETSTRVLR